MGIKLSDLPPNVRAVLEVKAPTPSKPRRGTLNKTEAEYLRYLNTRVMAGELSWISAHESIALTIAHGPKRAVYRPDFVVMNSSGRIEVHEVKGFWREAGRLRLKVAAGLYPFRFVAVTISRGRWNFEEFSEVR